MTQLNVDFLESQGEKQNGQNTTHRREDVNAIVKLHPRNFLMQPAESSILRQPFTGSTKLIPCVLSTGLATLVTVTPPTHHRSRLLTHCWDYCTRRDCCRRTRGCKEGQAAARARLGPSGASSGRSGHNSPTSTDRVGVGEGRVVRTCTCKVYMLLEFTLRVHPDFTREIPDYTRILRFPYISQITFNDIAPKSCASFFYLSSSYEAAAAAASRELVRLFRGNFFQGLITIKVAPG